MAKRNGVDRTSQGLRDLLFDEIDELRSGNGDPSKALAVANLARQIVNTAKVEMEFHRALAAQKETGDPMELGSLRLGSAKRSVASAAKPAMAA